MTSTTDRRRADPDRLAELEEERRFLLRSLSDLEREHAAGDVDDVDYAELRDGYTVRAAATLREIEQGRSALPAKPPADWRRRVLLLVAFVALVAVVWWVLAATTAQRLPNQSMTGADPRDERQQILSAARVVQAQEPAAAVELYTQLVDADPTDVEALTYRGWTLYLSAESADDITQAATDLNQATEIDPEYPDPWCFLGIIKFNYLGPADAEADLDRCLAFNPPAEVRGLIEGLLAQATATTAP